MYLITKPMAKYKKLGSVTLFDTQNTKENLSALGNPLERLSQVIDFEMFRNALEDVFENKKKKKQCRRQAIRRSDDVQGDGYHALL